MSRIRFEHRLLDGRFHVITSPDLKGFHVTGDSQEEAEREALAVLALIRQQKNEHTVLKAVEYEAA